MALPQPSIAQLRPALQRALDMAVAAPAGRSLPGPVRSLVRSRRRPAGWAVTMVRTLDEDEAFRAWVAEGASEEELGRLAWLWLGRPDGWAEELTGLIEDAAVADELDKGLRMATQRAASLERELAESRRDLAAARAAQSEMAAAAEEQRRSASMAEEERTAQLQSALTERGDRIEELSAAQSELESERARLARRVEDLEDRLAESELARAAAEERASRLAAERESIQRRQADLESESETRRADVASAVERAAAAAGELGSALASAAAALGTGVVGSDDGGGPEPPRESGSDRGLLGEAAPGHEAAPSDRVSPAHSASGGRGRPVDRAEPRRPVPLPPAVFEDSAEAASFLVRVPGVHIVVDGYNVALTSWSEPVDGRPGVKDLPALRRRLLDALSELVVRVQRTVTVVFDGNDKGHRVAVTGPARPWLRIMFSASTIEADEVILQSVRELRAETAVVVATNDREVRDGSRRLGANVISVGQLLTVLNRHTGV